MKSLAGSGQCRRATGSGPPAGSMRAGAPAAAGMKGRAARGGLSRLRRTRPALGAPARCQRAPARQCRLGTSEARQYRLGICEARRNRRPVEGPTAPDARLHRVESGAPGASAQDPERESANKSGHVWMCSSTAGKQGTRRRGTSEPIRICFADGAMAESSSVVASGRDSS